MPAQSDTRGADLRSGGQPGGWLQRTRRSSALPLAGLLLLAGGVSACGSRLPLPTRPAWHTLPAGSPLRSHTLPEQDAWLRHYLMFGEHPEAAGAFETDSPLAPRDRLLRSLQEAVVLNASGNHARSNELLEWAELEADLRYTRSLSREAASILVNDRVLAYTPTAGELAMVPYYRMLNHLALGDQAGALVEARKATALLARLERNASARCNGDGLIQYLAGIVQASAGETNDAVVSLRQAERSLSLCEGMPAGGAAAVAGDLYRVARQAGLLEIADSLAERYALPHQDGRQGARGDLLIIVEHGFVAHRVQEALHIPVPRDALEGLEGEDDEHVARAVARISSDLLLGGGGAGPWRQSRRGNRGSAWADALDGAYILRLAWPVYRREANGPRNVRIAVGDAFGQPVVMGNLSSLMRDELAGERPAMLGRLLLRGLTKYLVSRSLEDETEKKHGEAAGFILGRIANIAGNQLEQADTRTWSLLPDRVSLLRLRLSEGTHPLRLEVVSDGGGISVRDLGEVSVEAGGLTVVHERVWARDAESRWEEEFDPVEIRLESVPEEGEGPDPFGAVAADSSSRLGS